MYKSICNNTRLSRLSQPVRICPKSIYTSYSSYRNHYDVLGVDRSATDKQIKAAYIAMSKEYHPDTDHGNPVLPARFIEIKEAYEALNTIQKRKGYHDKMNVILTYDELKTRQYENFQKNASLHGHHWRRDNVDESSQELEWKFSVRGRKFVFKPLSSVWYLMLTLFSSWIILSMLIYVILSYL